MNIDDSQRGQASHQPFTDDEETLKDLSSRHVSSDAESGLRGRVPPAIADHELLGCIGRGSYGEVWLARNVMGVYRAVKIVYRDAFESDRPYEREFAGIKKFEPISRRHESQVDILHVGRNDVAGYFYYVMELADDANAECGVRSAESSEELPQSVLPSARCPPHSYQPRTLRSELKRCGRLPCEVCLDIALSLTTALQHLHTHGLIHRDIKPDNIIFIEGLPKLADIGLVTETGKTLSFVGTEGYLPPEGPSSAQADIFSLGKVLYEICTGKDRHEFPDMPTFIDAVPETTRLFEFNEVLIKACHSDRRERYTTAAQMHQDLLLLKAGKSVRRAHLLERRVAWLTKTSAVGVAVTALVVAGYFYQEHQSQKSHRFAAELQINQGVHFMDKGDLAGSLPWFVLAMSQARWTKEETEMHRFRLGSVLRHCPKLVQLVNHEEGSYEVEFSQDGQRLLTFFGVTNVQVSAVATGEPIAVLRHSNRVYQAALSPDGTRAVTLTGPALLTTDVEREVRVWDVNTGHPIGPPIRHSARSPRVIAGNDTDAGPIWDVLAGMNFEPSLDHPMSYSYPTRVAFSRDGRNIITAGEDGTVQIWNADSGKANGPALRPLQNGHLLGVSLDGRSMLTGTRHTVSLRDSRTGEERLPRFEFPEFRSRPYHVKFNPEAKKLLAVSFDSRVQVRDTGTGEELPVSLKHPDLGPEADLSPDGRFVVASGLTQIFEAATGTPITLPVLQNGSVSNARFHPDGRHFATGNGERLVRVWEITSGQFGGSVFRHSNGVTRAAFSPNGLRILTASRDGTARLWDGATGKEMIPALEYRGFRDYVRPSFSRDGKRILTATHANVIQLRDGATGEPLAPALEHLASVHHAEFSPDGKLVVTTTTDGNVKLWDADTREPVSPAIPKLAGDSFASFSPDGSRLATIGGTTTHTLIQAQVWNVTTGQPLTPPMQMYLSWGCEVTFSLDGNRLLTYARTGQMRVWDAHSGQPITPTFNHSGDHISGACFSPDGRSVLTAGSPQAARLWDATTGRQLNRPLEHQDWVHHAAFSPDGRRIVTASADHTARIWDARTGLPLTPPLQHSDTVTCAEFSPDGRRVITACDDGTARVWEFETNNWPVKDLRLLAELLSGRTIDGTGSFSALEPAALKETLRKLKSKHADYFADSP